MSNNHNLENRIREFFDADHNSMPYDEWYALEKRTAHLVDEYGWDAVRREFFHYVQTECKNPDDIARVAFRYEGLDWNKKPVPDPYDFLGYLYYKAGFRKAPYDAARALDDLCISILPASGCPEANIYYHPYYAAEADPKMIAAVERWRQREADDDTGTANESNTSTANSERKDQ
ncbi:hypothetical protein [Bifidobacterium simiarum]|uniref:Uncharacterized protein n=1 Tax=Bifidobacterium simiarum TaxID=2045441 RepID=A0A2M9HHA1_9BIFI|nr:hypothetical protein [Bifidobacterium simiarum]MBT1165276.1 hypothetical protein [Bifidobacterium simiarum]PJM76195.1 hypothetical protein CSQ87_01390 [Bifidobacterium simiarum]